MYRMCFAAGIDGDGNLTVQTQRRPASGGAGRLWMFFILAALAVGVGAPAVYGQIRVVNYNIAQMNGDLTALEDVIAEMHFDDTRGFAVPVTVFVFQEVDEDEFNQLSNIMIASAPVGVFYQPATFTSANEGNSGGAQACYYDNSIVTEDVTGHADIFTGAGRNSDRWRFTINGYDSPDASFYVYSSHLKAGSSGSDESTRSDGVTALQNNAAALPAGAHFIFAGDFNFSDNGEPAYQQVIAAGGTQMFDQLGSGSWSGSGNALKHTQSPRLPSGTLIGGGMDDRFDFQFINNDFNDGEGLARIIGDYRAVGNDGNHYNDSINTGNNTYFPGELSRSNSFADDLFDASDHIPVMADYQVPARLTVLLPMSDFGRVIQNTAFDIEIRVNNPANVVAPEGADELDYVVTGTGVVSGMISGSTLATAGPVIDFFAVDTSTTGVVNGGIFGTTTSEAAQIIFDTRATTGRIVRPANASFSDVADTDSTTVNKNYDGDTGLQSIDVPVYNFGFDADQALLDVDAVDPVSTPFGFTSGLTTGIGGSPATLSFSFDTTALAPGLYQETVDVTVSDEDIPGQVQSVLALTLSVTIDGVGTCPEDIEGNNGTIDVFDLLALLGAWGTNGPGADIAAPTNVVDVFDLLDLLSAWGVCP